MMSIVAKTNLLSPLIIFVFDSRLKVLKKWHPWQALSRLRNKGRNTILWLHQMLTSKTSLLVCVHIYISCTVFLATSRITNAELQVECCIPCCPRKCHFGTAIVAQNVITLTAGIGLSQQTQASYSKAQASYDRTQLIYRCLFRFLRSYCNQRKIEQDSNLERARNCGFLCQILVYLSQCVQERVSPLVLSEKHWKAVPFCSIGLHLFVVCPRFKFVVNRRNEMSDYLKQTQLRLLKRYVGFQMVMLPLPCSWLRS